MSGTLKIRKQLSIKSQSSLSVPLNKIQTLGMGRCRRRVMVHHVIVAIIPVVAVICVCANFMLVLQKQKQQQHQHKSSINERQVPQHQQQSTTNVHPTKGTIVTATTVAHVVSLIKCTKKSSVTGFLDAAAVLRHSIHHQSVHSTTTGNSSSTRSKYSYQMFAIVHDTCQDDGTVTTLSQLGYRVLIRPSPVLLDDIQPGWYRDHVEMENCCGSAEFIKLYSYTLTEYPITVHWDLDVALLQPMDDLFDAILFDKNSFRGRQARRKLDLQHPHRPLPDRIDAFFTRDITSAQPWEIRQGVQGGFLVARPNQQHFDRYIEFIKRGNYTSGGRGNDKGWDGLGYGGFQGAMAYQGVVAYFYDQIVPHTAVELDVCIWNQVVADVIWRGPNGMDHLGECREYPISPGVPMKDNTPEMGRCKDCRILPIDQVKSVHYTACKKPWECTLPYPRKPKQKNKELKLKELTNITTCGLLFQKWFDLRQDFENKLQEFGNVLPSPRTGRYEKQYFGGYCQGQGHYVPMNPPPKGFDVRTIYGV
jgi:alpha-N-acetylglucosamine transferase